MKKPTKYLKEKLIELFKIFKQPAIAFTHEHFHKIRVAIKKLKSFLDLLQFTSSVSTNVLKPLKKIFRISGKIRNHQITITKLLSLYPRTINNYILSIDKKIKILKIQFFQLLNRISFKQIYTNYKKQLKYSKPITYNSVFHYINTLKSEIIYTFYTIKEKQETLHAERILLKKYIYVQELIKSPAINQNEMIVLTELLGNLHDNQIIENQLKKSLQSGKLFFTELEAINNCLKIISKIKKQFYNQSIKKFLAVVIDNPIFLTFRVYI